MHLDVHFSVISWFKRAGGREPITTFLLEVVQRLKYLCRTNAACVQNAIVVGSTPMLQFLFNILKNNQAFSQIKRLAFIRMADSVLNGFK